MSHTPPDIESLLPLRPPARQRSRGARAAIRERLHKSATRLVVLDDDPTGTQTVHDVPVYLEWSPAALAEALREDSDLVYISTNSRALARDGAAELGRVLGERLREAEQETGTRALMASRSDSTLRGHYPAEVEALAAGYGEPPDGVITCPAFFEGGRYTAGDIHYVLRDSVLTPAAETEFARDPVFGYTHSNLREWVAEKTGGRWRPEEVGTISLEAIRRGGPEHVCALLTDLTDSAPVIVNALCYDDLDRFVLGLIEAEDRGKRFVYRCAASFVKARAGLEDRPLLTRLDLGAPSGPGLVVVGSWVERTSKQLSCLLADPQVAGVELDARACAGDDAAARETAVRTTAAEAAEALRADKTAAVYTSRDTLAVAPDDFPEAGRRVMAALCTVVQRLNVRVGFVVAKGGITSIETARTALGARRARVLGQIAEGVPVWRLAEESRWAGLPYVVFPGNVGGESTLRDVVRMLEGKT